MQICNFTRTQCCEGLTFAQQNIKVFNVSPLYRFEGNNFIYLYLRKFSLSRECAIKRINFHKNLFLQSLQIWRNHQKLFQRKTWVNRSQIFINNTSVPYSIMLLLVQLLLSVDSMFLSWTWTLNFIYIESPDALCKQRTGKLYNSLCPKPHLRNSGSRKLLNVGFFPGNWLFFICMEDWKQPQKL